MSSEERTKIEERLDEPDSVKPSRLWRRVRVWLTLVMMAALAEAWAFSMKNFSDDSIGLGPATFQAINFAGTASISLRSSEEKTYFLTDSAKTPLNQETLFPGPKWGTGSTGFHFIVAPHWLLIMATFFLGIAGPEAWRRWESPASPGKRTKLLRWCGGWVVLALALILGGRWWSLHEPRVDETRHFRLTGANEPGLAVKGRMRGLVTNIDGSPVAKMAIVFANAGTIQTDPDGRFDVPYTPSEVLFLLDSQQAGWDPVKISIDPDRPMYWRIRRKHMEG